MRDLAVVGSVAARAGARVLVVGGLVRDVLLGRPTHDVDLVVGEAGQLVDELASALGGAVAAESQFETYRIELADGRKIDLATARRETYGRPGALPTISPGTFKDDLARRDFTINAMAVELGEPWGDLIDPLSGHADLAARRLKVLHSRSFLDDPTRVLRGIELAVRLGFSFEDLTAGEARRALADGVLESLSRARWCRAWRRSFGRFVGAGAGSLERALELAEDLGLLAALATGLTLDEAIRGRARRLERPAGAGRSTALARSRLLARALAWDDRELARALAERWVVESDDVAAWISFGERMRQLEGRLSSGGDLRPSRVAEELTSFDDEEIALLELEAKGELAHCLDLYWTRVRPARLSISGGRLLEAGFEPGPAIGRALERTLEARMDGRITAAEELEYASSQLETGS
jgi:tRNA nucleotidyltransferase (CCA-adding enzyme)